MKQNKNLAWVVLRQGRVLGVCQSKAHARQLIKNTLAEYGIDSNDSAVDYIFSGSDFIWEVQTTTIFKGKEEEA